MQWVLHIGTQKTGSKAIQHVLSDELHRVVGATVYYPQSGRAGLWHEPLHDALSGGDRKLLAAALQEARAAGADYTVLSYEGLYELPVAALQLVRESIGEAQIVLFLRRQDSLLNSWYNQLIKAHKVTIDEIRNFERSLTDYHLAFDHSATLEKWASVFGWPCQRPLIYEKSSCAVDTFLGVLASGLDRDALKLPNFNKALDARQAGLLRGVKEALGNSPRLPEIIQLLHEELAGELIDTFRVEESYLFDLATREKILSLYEESNERVRERCFSKAPRLFAAMEVGEYRPLNIDEGREAARTFLKRVREPPARLPPT